MTCKLTFLRYGYSDPKYCVKEFTPEHYFKIDPTKTPDQHTNCARIVFAPVQMLFNLHKLVHFVSLLFCNVPIVWIQTKRNCFLYWISIRNKYDVIFYDHASESDELTSIIPLLFSPSTFILFGDPDKQPHDILRLDQKYNGHRLNQSMFKRLMCAEYGNALKLDDQNRFSATVHKFLNVCIYGSKLAQFSNKNSDSDQIAGFRMFHRKNDGLMFELLQRLLEISPPAANNTYSLILPPNIQRDDLNHIIR